MFDRRSFLLKSGPAVALSAAFADARLNAAEEKPASGAGYIELSTFRLHFGAQMDRLMAWLEERAMPVFQKHLEGPSGIFTVEVGPHVPAVVFIHAYPSLAALESAIARLGADEDWVAAMRELESEGPAFEREDFTILRALPFSTPLKAAAEGGSAHKIYELRTYEASTYRQLEFMHQRFNPAEIDVFDKCGIHPCFYADTFIGSNLPNMVYMIPFESEAHREKAWAAFRAHPDWAKIAEEWMKKSGELARNISSSILVPTSFSMIR